MKNFHHRRKSGDDSARVARRKRGEQESGRGENANKSTRISSRARDCMRRANNFVERGGRFFRRGEKVFLDFLFRGPSRLIILQPRARRFALTPSVLVTFHERGKLILPFSSCYEPSRGHRISRSGVYFPSRGE